MINLMHPAVPSTVKAWADEFAEALAQDVGEEWTDEFKTRFLQQASELLAGLEELTG